MAKETRTKALDVTFEEDIPKISREGGERRSKYDDLLDKVKERATKEGTKNPVAVLKFDSTGKATSRYTSVKDAVSKREDADHWTVAVRTHEDNDIRLYIKWSEEAQEEETE